MLNDNGEILHEVLNELLQLMIKLSYLTCWTTPGPGKSMTDQWPVEPLSADAPAQYIRLTYTYYITNIDFGEIWVVYHWPLIKK